MNTLHPAYDERFEAVSDETIELRKTQKQHAI
jgi:hypothetical protein